MRLSWKGMIVAAAAGVMMTLGVGGCSVMDYCEASTECEGGNIKDERACRAYTRGERNAAGKYGCRSDYNKYLSCIADKGSCESGYFDDHQGECSSEAQDLFSCIDDESGY